MSQQIIWNNGLISNPFQAAGNTVQNSLTLVAVSPIDLEDIYDLLMDVLIPNQEALLACCGLANKRILSLSKENVEMKKDLKLLIASNERLKKGRL